MDLPNFPILNFPSSGSGSRQKFQILADQDQTVPIRLETITKRQTSGFGGGGFGMVNCGWVHKLNWGGMDKLLKSVVGLAPPENSFSHSFLTGGKFDRNTYSTLSLSERCGFFWVSPLFPCLYSIVCLFRLG